MAHTGSSKELCDDGSKQFYNLILNQQRKRYDIKDIGMLQLIDEVDRLRQIWKNSEESKDKLNDELNRTERLFAEAKKKHEILEMEMKDARKHMRMLMDENKALKLDLDSYETRERRLKTVMKNGVFNSLSKEDRDQFVFLREPLVRTYSKRLQQKHPHLVDESQEAEDDEEVDYDVTGDSLDDLDEPSILLRHGREIRRSSASKGGRRSASAHATASMAAQAKSKRSRSRIMATATIEEEPTDGSTPPKRSRDQHKSQGSQEMTSTTATTTTTTTIKGHESRNQGGRGAGADAVNMHRSVTRRSLSVGSVPPSDKVYAGGGLTSSAVLTKSTLDMRSLRRGIAPSWTSGNARDIAMRPHTFEDTGMNWRMTKCDKCHKGGIFTTATLKCKDCHQTVHRQCASGLHVPCIPRQKTISTPKTPSRNAKREYRLQDFCTSAKPMIPFPIVHCVVTLEKRALTQEGLYRVPGSTIRVTKLLDELRTARTVPNLDLQSDPEVITETLKRFLRDLRDPLVPRTSREELIMAANMVATNPEQGRITLNRVICELPQANRDTMAYLFLHWRKVISMCEMNKMPVENMSRVLAPCVMGLPTHRMDQAAASHDITNCERSMGVLFSFDDVYWQRFLSPAEPVETARGFAPQSRAAMDCSILGPLTSPATPVLTRAAAARRPNAYMLGSLKD